MELPQGANSTVSIHEGNVIKWYKNDTYKTELIASRLLEDVSDVFVLPEIHKHNTMRMYGIMPYIGEDMFHWIEEKVLTRSEIKHIFKTIAKGLVDMHEAGFMHMDIKPENILWDGKDVVKLCDFGCFTGKGVPTLGRLGTLLYLAPEHVIQDCPPSPKSDVYAFGATLMAASCRRLVAEDATDQLVVFNSPEYIKPEKGDDPVVFDLVQKCTSLDPRDRLSMSEVVSEMEKWDD